MTYLLESYDLLERMNRAFRIDNGDNTNATTSRSRTASVNNSATNLEPNETALKINQLVKAMNGQRVGSINASTKVVDEIALLKSFMKQCITTIQYVAHISITFCRRKHY